MKALTYVPHVPPPSVHIVRRRIAEALRHSAAMNGTHIDVAVRGYTVTLSGTVHTWLQREAAERAALAVPGVTALDNRLDVHWPGDELEGEAPEICQ
jgi:osmotically-inducible protein OsmY